MAERNCSNCGREISAGRRFCGGCGRPVTANAELGPAEPVARFCEKCGAAYVPGKRFCKQCGHAVGSTVPTEANGPSAVAQAEPAATKAVLGEASGRAIPVIAIPTQPELTALLCSECGAAIVPGKRFCKQCGHAVGSTNPLAAKEPSAVVQGESGTKNAVLDEASAQALPEIAVLAKPEQTALLCPKCGAVIVLGKRFCKQCGHALATPSPTATFDSHPIQQGESTARGSTVRVLESDHTNTPPLQSGTRGQTFPIHIDSAPSEILPRPPSKAESGTGPDEDLKPASLETQDVSSYEEDSRPLLKFGGDEQDSPTNAALQADFAVNAPDITSSERHELGDGDAGMFRSFQDTAVPQRRTLLLVLGIVCAAAFLGAAWLVATSYHGRHRSVQIATQPTLPPVVAMSSSDQTSKPGPQTVPGTPIKPAKPAPPRQEVGGYETRARHLAPKPDASNSHSTSPRPQGGNCALDSNMLSKMLDQADRNRAQGNYSDAARQYRSVLNCDSNNARAHSGLELTLLDIQHQ